MVYFLKINVAIALFYAFYRLFFYKDTFFAWRRTALLCFFAVSAAVPLLNIQHWIVQQEPMAAMADLYATVVLPELTLTPQPETDWQQLTVDGIVITYWLVAFLLAVRFFAQLVGIFRLARRCPTQKIDGTNVHLLPRAEGPFSFFRWIFVCPEAHTNEELNEILTHGSIWPMKRYWRPATTPAPTNTTCWVCHIIRLQQLSITVSMFYP